LRYGFVIDQTTCIGCHACTVACKTEHEVPLGVNRTWVKYVEKGAWPDTKRFFSVMRCNHCTDAPCVTICPTTALNKRADGIVDFDTDRCIGCKSCMQACPYDALYIDPQEHTAQKCNYCVHRVEVGLEPACVVVCPEQAIIAGDLDDPSTRIAQMVATDRLSQRAVEQGTKPNLWYKGADEASLDPLAAVSTNDGGIWRDPAESWLAVDLTPPTVTAASASVTPDRPPRVVHEGHNALPRVVYNTDHPMPWGWRVSSYFLTKGIAAGIAIALAMSLLADAGTESAWARWGAPLAAGLFLLLTGVLLVWDLKRPDRFLYLMTKGNPGSWLVRGAWILGAYAAVLGVWFLVGVFASDGPVVALIWIGAVIGLGVAGYTAFLFGQAEARDLWQSPTLLWHMVAGAFAAGGGSGLVFALVFEVGEVAEQAFAWSMVGGVVALGLIAVAELVSQHPTRNIADAVHHMTKGKYAKEWWFGGQVGGVLVPLVLGALFLGGAGLWAGALGGVAAAAGIWFADDAFVKAGQSVPLS
jgi:Fe-S-cluster-containing dehydrogenase component/formate-dependent nitrite reductase membrane component NrfD